MPTKPIPCPPCHNRSVDFDYTPEQMQLRREVREFAAAEIAPHVMEWDETQTFPLAVIKKLGQLGYMGAIFPEEYGGAGLGYVEYSIIIEELSRVDGSVGIILAAHTSLCSNHIYKAGTEEQKRKYLPKLASRRMDRLLVAHRARSRLGRRRHPQHRGSTTATRWIVNGSKTFTTNAHYADVCVGHGGDRPRRRAARHLGLHFRKGHARFPRREEGKQARPARQRHGRSDFRQLPHAASQMLGKQGEGFVDSLRILDGGRVSISALSIGMAQGAYDAALKYSKLRKQFGRPISEFQAIQHKLVDMATKIDASRLLTYRAAKMIDAGKRVTKESAMAKLFASEAAVWIANEAVQIFGGYGFIKDYPVEKFYRDVKLCTIGEGTSEIQRLVIARQLLKD